MSNSLIQSAENVIKLEAQAVSNLVNNLDENFVNACKLIQNCQGKVVLIGMGKSGHIGNKIAATFASTGTPSFAVHPGEAGHGDLGMIDENDVVIAISYSGEAGEIITLIPTIQRLGVPIIAMTGKPNSSIAKAGNIHLNVSVEKEACPHNLAPTSSTTAALVMGDALAVSLLSARGFSSDDFARSHPSGALGRRLLTLVKDIMKTGADIPIVSPKTDLLEALITMSQKGLGMILIAENKALLGVFTDGDLRRVLQANSDIQNLNMAAVMNPNFQSISADKPAVAAVQIMEEFGLNSLPVLDAKNQIVGVINNHILMHAKII